MRHSDREIRDREIIKAMLDMCEIINIGFIDEEYPYVLPVNFGYEYEDDLIFYCHHAVEGYKNKLIEKYPKVCVVTHRFIDRIHNEYDHSSHDYRSVMAFGEISVIPRESDDYRKAWECLAACNNCNYSDRVYSPEFKVMMCKIVCRPDNVIGKAQRSIADVKDVPFNYDHRVKEDRKRKSV